MSLTRVSLCCVVLLAWASFAPVHSQEPAPIPGTASLGDQSQMGGPPPAPQQDYYPQGGVPSYAPPPGPSGYVPLDPFGVRFSVRSDIGDGPGWANGFQSLNGFVPITFEPDRSLLFINGRAIATNNGSFTGNIGAGMRWYSPDLDRVFGGSFWYDYDNSNFTNYDQWGISLESLGKYFDVRLNAYIPSNDNQSTVKTRLNGNISFINDNIGIGTNRMVENALRGGDLEVGGALPLFGDYGLRSYIGGYYFQAPSVETTVGFKYRSEIMVTQDIQLQVGASSDKLFGQNVYGAVTYYFPDGRPSRILSRQPVRERLYTNVERNYRLNVYRRELKETIISINPDTGLPYVVHHVDNINAPGTGDGRVQNPFGSLADAAPGADIVFVHHNQVDGGGNPILTGYDTGITLFDNQRLLGQGTDHLFTDLKFGTLTLPGNDGGPMPVITNPAGDVVTLANNNEVSGFQIGGAAPNNPSGNGIFGAGITDFNINRNTILNAGAAGIAINGAGTGFITDNTITGSTNANIEINNTTGTALTLDVTDNIASTGLAGLILRGDGAGSDIDAVLSGNTFNSNDNSGMDISASNGSVATVVGTGNVSNSNGADGVLAKADNGTLNLGLFDQTSSLNTGNGLNLATVNGGVLNTQVDTATLTSNTLNGLNVLADTGTVTFASFSNSVLNTNTQFGAVLNANNGGAINGQFDGNSLLNNVAGGLTSTLNNGSSSTINFLDNTIGGVNGTTPAFGAAFIAQNGSTIDHIFDGNTISNNAGIGLRFAGTGGSTVNYAMTNNDILNNGGIGLSSSVIDGFATISITDKNVFSGNVDAGAMLSYSGSTVATQVIDDNLFENTTDNAATSSPNGQGLVVALGGTAVLESTITNNFFQNNVSDGVLMNLGGSSNLAVNDFNNNNLLTNGRDGLSMQLTNGAVAVLNADLNNITTQGTVNGTIINGVNGVNLDLMAGSKLTANLTNNTIDGSSDGTNFSTGSGVLMNIRQDGELNATLTNNAIRQNGVDGVHVGPDPLQGVSNQFHASQETAIINVSLQNNLIELNRDDGVQVSTAQVSAGASAFTGSATYVLNGNIIRDNGTLTGTVRTGNGVNAEVRSGQMDIVLTNNTITGNIADGVLLRNSMGSAVGSADITSFTRTFLGDTSVYSVLNAVVDGNTISNNGNRGVDIKFEDITTNFDRQGYGARGNIAVSNNTIDNNGDEGIYVLTNTEHDDGFNFNGWDHLDVNENVAAPFTVNPGNLAELTFTAVGNSITNNGGKNAPDNFGAVAGDGLFVLVGTGSYVRADIRDNTFSGNYLDDFHTDSFVAGPQTPATDYNSPIDTTSRVYLDRAARLDLRFTGNVGNSIGSVTSFTGFNPSRIVSGKVKDGFFDVLDAEQTAPVVQQKSFVFGRQTDFFRVEDTPTPVGSVLNGTNFFSAADSQFPRNNFLNNGYFQAPIGSLFP
ncbi:MAG: hypothetical protein V4719_29930 [Planctomycetota bacterium]